MSSFFEGTSDLRSRRRLRHTGLGPANLRSLRGLGPFLRFLDDVSSRSRPSTLSVRSDKKLIWCRAPRRIRPSTTRRSGSERPRSRGRRARPGLAILQRLAARSFRWTAQPVRSSHPVETPPQTERIRFRAPAMKFRRACGERRLGALRRRRRTSSPVSPADDRRLRMNSATASGGFTLSGSSPGKASWRMRVRVAPGSTICDADAGRCARSPRHRRRAGCRAPPWTRHRRPSRRAGSAPTD